MLYYFGPGGIFKTFLTLLENRTVIQDHPIHQSLSYLFTGVELLLILIAFVTYPIFLKVLFNSVLLHDNLVRVFAVKVLHLLAQDVFRLVLMLYEFGWLGYTGAPNSAPFLFFISLGRQHCLCVGALAMLFILVERLAATCFVLDYESNKRPWISWIIIPIQITSCFLIVFGVLTGAAYDIMITICLIGPAFSLLQIILTVADRLLRKYNKGVLWQIAEHPFKGKRYSLTTRYQLEENLRGLELLNRLLSTATVFNFLYGVFVVIAYALFDEGTPIAQVVFSMLDLCFAWYPIMILFLSLWTVDEWRTHYQQIVCSFFGWKTPAHKRKIVFNIDSQTEANLYFQYYNNRW